jgi:hypothetical protein
VPELLAPLSLAPAVLVLAEADAVVPAAVLPDTSLLPLLLPPAREPSIPRMRSKFSPAHHPEMAGSESMATGLGGGGGGTAASPASEGGGLGCVAMLRDATGGIGAGLAFLAAAGASTMYFGMGRERTTTVCTGGRGAGCAVAVGSPFDHAGTSTGGKLATLGTCTMRGGIALGSARLWAGTGESEGNCETACAAASVRDTAKNAATTVRETPAMSI